MARKLSADDAAALFEPRDTFAMPLGPGQPPALLEALGKREDWEELRIGTALLFVLTPSSITRTSITSRASTVRSSARCAIRAPTSASPLPTSGGSSRYSRTSTRA
jgi:hypothetical protein